LGIFFGHPDKAEEKQGVAVMEQSERDLMERTAGIREVDEAARLEAEAHTSRLVMPPRAMGRLHDTGERLWAISGGPPSAFTERAVIVFAGDHGVVEEGVTAFPQVVSQEMIRCFLRGGAGINVMADRAGADVFVVDIGTAAEMPEEDTSSGRFFSRRVGRGTANLARGPAMSRDQAARSVLYGYEIAADRIRSGVQLLGTGDMGIGNTTPSSAVGAVLTGYSVQEMVGRGTGIDDERLGKKRAAVSAGLERNDPDPGDGLDVLAKVGGFEIGGIAGCILAAAGHGIPVALDGLISTAGALIADSLAPASRGYMFAGHVSEEPGHKNMLRHLGLTPLLDLGMRLGEGTGAALAMNLLDAAAALCSEVMTFDQAGVSAE
jgi:nicotinate-nucleotide--dimethylbenzimidazole phosphoribosyltransferase